MRERGVREPVARFDIAPFAPAEVQSAEDNFRRVVTEYRDAKSLLSEEIELGRVRISQAHQEASRARVEGSARPKLSPGAVKEEHEIALEALVSDVNVLKDAVDEAGNELADAIEKNKAGSWLDTLETAKFVAEASLVKALDDARKAIAILGPARRGPDWLRSFSVRAAVRGEQTQFAGAEVTIDTNHIPANSFVDPLVVLDFVAQAVKPIVPRPPRALKVVRESSMSAEGVLVRKATQDDMAKRSVAGGNAGLKGVT